MSSKWRILNNIARRPDRISDRNNNFMNTCSLILSSVTKEEVFTNIISLKSLIASGIDGITGDGLKVLVDRISVPLVSIFNDMIEKKCFMKFSKIRSYRNSEYWNA